MKEITTLTQELKKLRLGTNFEKIRDTIQKIFAVLDVVDDRYFARKEEESETIAAESVVTTTDVDRELEKLEEIKILKDL